MWIIIHDTSDEIDSVLFRHLRTFDGSDLAEVVVCSLT